MSYLTKLGRQQLEADFSLGSPQSLGWGIQWRGLYLKDRRQTKPLQLAFQGCLQNCAKTVVQGTSSWHGPVFLDPVQMVRDGHQVLLSTGKHSRATDEMIEENAKLVRVLGFHQLKLSRYEWNSFTE